MDQDPIENAAERLQFTAELALTLFEHSPDAILLVDEYGVIVRANRQAELLFGYPRSDLNGSNVDMLLPDHLTANHQNHRAGFMEDPRLRPMGIGLDLSTKRKNGNLIAVEINLSPLAMKQGMFVIATIRRKK